MFTFEVLFERTRLSKWVITYVTLDRPLACVNLQVVQEIALLFENSITCHANQNCVRSACLRVQSFRSQNLLRTKVNDC